MPGHDECKSTRANDVHQLGAPSPRLMVRSAALGRASRTTRRPRKSGPTRPTCALIMPISGKPEIGARRILRDADRAARRSAPQDEVGASERVAYPGHMLRLLVLALVLIASAPLRADPIADALSSSAQVSAFLDALGDRQGT